MLAGELASIRLTVDPRLNLQEFLPDQPVKAYRVEEHEQDQNIVHLELDRTYAAGSRVLLRTRFLADEVMGMGQITVPIVSIDARLSSGFWLAVSLPPTLEARLSRASNARSISPVELSATWSLEMPPPALAYYVANRAKSPTLEVQPRGPVTNVRQETIVSVGLATADVFFRAQRRYHPGVRASTPTSGATEHAAKFDPGNRP